MALGAPPANHITDPLPPKLAVAAAVTVGGICPWADRKTRWQLACCWGALRRTDLAQLLSTGHGALTLALCRRLGREQDGQHANNRGGLARARRPVAHATRRGGVTGGGHSMRTRRGSTTPQRRVLAAPIFRAVGVRDVHQIPKSTCRAGQTQGGLSVCACVQVPRPGGSSDSEAEFDRTKREGPEGAGKGRRAPG